MKDKIILIIIISQLLVISADEIQSDEIYLPGFEVMVSERYDNGWIHVGHRDNNISVLDNNREIYSINSTVISNIHIMDNEVIIAIAMNNHIRILIYDSDTGIISEDNIHTSNAVTDIWIGDMNGRYFVIYSTIQSFNNYITYMMYGNISVLSNFRIIQLLRVDDYYLIVSGNEFSWNGYYYLNISRMIFDNGLQLNTVFSQELREYHHSFAIENGLMVSVSVNNGTYINMWRYTEYSLILMNSSELYTSDYHTNVIRLQLNSTHINMIHQLDQIIDNTVFRNNIISIISISDLYHTEYTFLGNNKIISYAGYDEVYYVWYMDITEDSKLRYSVFTLNEYTEQTNYIIVAIIAMISVIVVRYGFTKK